MGGPTRSPFEEGAEPDVSMDGVGLLDGDTFVTANEELAATYGYDDPDRLAGTAWHEYYAAADRERIERDALPAARAGNGWRGEVTGTRTDGTPFRQVLSIRGDGNGRIVWVVRDLVEEVAPDLADDSHWRATTATNGSTWGDPDGNGERHPHSTSSVDRPGTVEGIAWTRFRALFERAPVAGLVATLDRGIVYCNGAAVDLVGADDREEVVGLAPERFVHPGQRDRARRCLRRVIEERVPAEPSEYLLAGLDDRVRNAEIAAGPVTVEGTPGTYVFVDDVTRLRNTEYRLRRDRRFLETIIDAVDDIVYVIDERGRASLWNDALAETTGYSHGEIESMEATEFVPEDQHEYVPGLMDAIDSLDDRRIELDVLTSDGERIEHEFRGTTFGDPGTGDVYRCGIARDITERLERERQLERQRDELATLDRINRILRETTRELVETADRGAIERSICASLVETDLYEFAWIGERAFDGDRIVPRTAAGDDRGYLDATETRAHGGPGGPADLALRTGEVHVVRADDPAGAPWPNVASECGFDSIAAVPLRHDGTVYGVLTIHTARENAFSDRVQDDFDVLGRTVGFVVNAARSHDLLFSDAVVELELHLAGEGSILATLASDLDCDLELEGHVATGRRWVLYLDVRNGRSDDVVALANDEPDVERARVVGSSDAGGRVELVVSNPVLLTTVRNAGASVRTLTAEPQGIRLIAEVPVDCDVREILEPIRREFPDTRLDARRDRDRGVTTAGHPDGILGGLTDRQREVMEAAYRAGYFSWPRDSTANEVAESLDLASATLHGHLRKAEATILATLFDGE